MARKTSYALRVFIWSQVADQNYSSKVVSLSLENRTITNDYRFTMVQFTVPHCPFTRKFRPVYRQLAEIFAQNDRGKNVLFAIVNCEEQEVYCEMEQIEKYPTLKFMRYGRMMTDEYRGPRTFEDIWKFVSEQVAENILHIDAMGKSALKVASGIPSKKAMIGGIFTGDFHKNRQYRNFKVAAYLEKDNCDFYVVYNATERENQMLLQEAMTQKILEVVPLEGMKQKQIQEWMNRKCMAVIREITFLNAEGIIAEGRPLLLLFHGDKALEIKKQFYELIRSHFQEDQQYITFLTADGNVFENALNHLNHTLEDLPLIYIDSLRHMYELRENIDEVLQIPSYLRKFLDDFYTGDLHYKYHEQGLDSFAFDIFKEFGHLTPVPMVTPAESLFSKLGPSKEKYTMKREEL